MLVAAAPGGLSGTCCGQVPELSGVSMGLLRQTWLFQLSTWEEAVFLFCVSQGC